MGNLFTEEQLRFFYKDQSFITFLSDYFTSFEVTNQNTDMDVDDDGVNNINIYARILIANVGQFYQMLDCLNSQISFSHNKVIQSCQGEIRGVLLIDQYAKEIISRHFPRRYECVQKRKTHCTPENVLIYFTLLKIRESMERFLISVNDTNSAIRNSFRGSPEYKKVFECIGKCEDYLSSRFLIDCRKDAMKYINAYGFTMPIELMEAIENRIRDERIINITLYKELVLWIKKFLKRGVAFITPHVIDILRYDDTFADVLFELWTLYSLKNAISRVHEFDAVEYLKFEREDGIVYRCFHKQDVVEFIYQKGKDVYWDSETHISWRYCYPTSKNLVGKPDITIRVSGSKNRLIMFDSKNRIRENGQISEELYKMIGYFDNFKEMFEGPKYFGTPKECILVFRGDSNPFIKELKKTNSDYSIRAVAVSPTYTKMMNDDQFEYIANAIVKIIE